MRIKQILSALVALALLAATAVFTTGCVMDTGDFESDDAYYEAFGDIRLVDQSGAKTTYSLRDDFYNEDTMVDLKTSVPDAPYVFFLIEIERDMQLEEMYMYIKGQKDVRATLSFFVLSDDPAVPMSLDAEIPTPDPTDPIFSPVIAPVSVPLRADKWTSFFAGSIGVENADHERRLHPGDVLCIRFDNNTCYGKADDLTPFAFTLTNFIVRIKN